MAENNFFHLIPQGGFLYFNYGLAFIVLGVVIVSKNMKGSRLRISIPLRYLALFGFTHGTLEWSELFLLFQGPLMTQPQYTVVKSIGLVFGILSFFSLIMFSFSLMRRISEEKYKKLIYGVPLAVAAVWASSMLSQWLNSAEEPLVILQNIDVISRLYLAFSGSLLTALALLIYSRMVKNKSDITAENFFRASLAFFIYGILAGLIPSKIIVPVVNIPIEFLRMLAAVSITLFIVKGLNIFDLETRRMVSEQTKKLVQAEKLASLGRLAAGVAHEINNPLTNASLNLQMAAGIIMREREKDDTLIKKVEAIGRNIDRASIIAKELLQFSRSDLGLFSEVNVNVVVQNAVDTLDYKLDNITVKKRLQSIPNVLGSPGKLQQVFINLLHNSIEAMIEGGQIEITTKAVGDSVQIKIADNGMGISPEKLEDLYDPFFTTKEIGKGTGLGLFICYGIIQQHNGSINIESKVGRGTAVTIELPLNQGNYEEDTHRR